MTRRRTSSVLAICALTVGLLAAACAPPPPPPVENWRFQSTQVQMANSTDEVYFPNPFGEDPCIAIPNCNDEPYVINIFFRAKFGVPGSAQAGVVATDECSPEISVGNGAVVGLSGCSAGTVNFNNVQMLDLADLGPANPLEVMGVWQWVMEEDQFGIDAGGIAAAFQKVLNDTIASGQAPPSDSLVSYLISVLFSGGFVQSFSTAIGLLGINIPLLGDDALGSRLYASLNVRGTLSDIIGNTTTPGGISVGFGIPTIQSISIAGLGNSPVNYDGFGSNGADGDHRYWNQWARG